MDANFDFSQSYSKFFWHFGMAIHRFNSHFHYEAGPTVYFDLAQNRTLFEEVTAPHSVAGVYKLYSCIYLL